MKVTPEEINAFKEYKITFEHQMSGAKTERFFKAIPTKFTYKEIEKIYQEISDNLIDLMFTSDNIP
ncbi:MAG: hypothetical protein INQ03_00755 [Candidatus Heimdallarchaeota archaeon]|nr:hypothetical protein [Candidatus Heimdallarchaeota archaeon]